MKSLAVLIGGAAMVVGISGCVVVPGGSRQPRTVVVHQPTPPTVKVVRPPMPSKPKIVIPVRPSPHHVWVDGEYQWNGKAWIWKPGYWKAGPAPKTPPGKAKGHDKH